MYAIRSYYGVTDPTAGFVCYRRQTLEALDLDAIHSNGYSFQIEMKYRVAQAGMRIEEVPIVFVDRRVGHSPDPDDASYNFV